MRLHTCLGCLLSAFVLLSTYMLSLQEALGWTHMCYGKVWQFILAVKVASVNLQSLLLAW